MFDPRHSSVACLTAVLLLGAACDDETPTDPALAQASVSSNATSQGVVAGSNGSAVQSVGTGAAADGREYAASAPDAGEGATPLVDAQIISVLSTSNASAIERSSIASDVSRNASVRELAQDLSATRLAAQERLTVLVSSGNFTAAFDVSQAENTASQKLQDDTKAVVDQLRDAEPSSFDLLFLQTHIDLLVTTLELIDTRLLPSVENLLLRAEVQRVRAETALQLQRARALLASLELDTDAGIPDSDAGL